MAGNWVGKAGALLCAFATIVPQVAQARLQCVPYARDLSGVSIQGNAHTWWSQAEGRYARGNAPREGAVLAFKSSRAMPLGHVAYVERVVGPREVIIDHANWSRPGGIERSVRAIDVSPAGDWSEVRVWHSPTATMGLRVNPTYGFIYNEGGSAPAAPSEPLLGREIYALAALEASSGR